MPCAKCEKMSGSGRGRRRHLLEELLGLLEREVLVLLEVGHRDEPVAVDALRLVQPELRDLERLLELLGLALSMPWKTPAMWRMLNQRKLEAVLRKWRRRLMQLQRRLHHALADPDFLGELGRWPTGRVIDGVQRLERRVDRKVAKRRWRRGLTMKEPAVGFIAARYCVLSSTFWLSLERS